MEARPLWRVAGTSRTGPNLTQCLCCFWRHDAHAWLPAVSPPRPLFAGKILPNPPSASLRLEVCTSATSPEVPAASDEWCAAPFVSADNTKNPNFTVLEVEILDYPGLMRVIAWCLNGLDLVAQNAVLSTSTEGVAQNTFWLSTRRGRKLSDSAADLLVDRMRDTLAHCSPKPGEEIQTEFSAGPIAISNSQHLQYTVITIRERQRTPGFLLEVASVLSALSVQVLQGVIQGCDDCGDDVPSVTVDSSLESWDDGRLGSDGARVFKFWVRGRKGDKLSPTHARALLYALGVGLGISSQKFPLVAPNMEHHYAL